MRNRIFVAGLAALVGCSSNNGNNVTCGDGTTLVGSECVANNGGGGSGGSGSGGSGSGDTGNDVTCGSGTVLDGDTCVPAPNDASAPAITGITPSDWGAYGHAPFEIDGSGFAGDNVTSLSVFFGDPTNPDCQAFIGPATPTVITGEIPALCDVNVQVSVITNLGSATVPFHYDAIFAADGDGGGNFAGEGEMWVIDPFVPASFDLGPIYGGSGSAAEYYGIAGLAFDGSGGMWGTTTGLSDGDYPAGSDEPTGYSQLVKIAPSDEGFEVTPIGSATDGTHDYYVSDLKWSNGTLYGIAYEFATTAKVGLVAIDPATGRVTAHGLTTATAFENDFYGEAALGIDGSGSAYVVANGAGADAIDGATGVLDTANLSTGALTNTGVVLAWGPGAPVTAMDHFTSAAASVDWMVAVVDNGAYNAFFEAEEGESAGLSGESLAIIDPAATGSADDPTIGWYSELPGDAGESADISGIAIVQSSTATIDLAHAKVSNAAAWRPLQLHATTSLAQRVHR